MFPFINEGEIIDAIAQSSSNFDLSAYSNFRYLLFSNNSVPFSLSNNNMYAANLIFCDKNLKIMIKAQGDYAVSKNGDIYTYDGGGLKYKICIIIA